MSKPDRAMELADQILKDCVRDDCDGSWFDRDRAANLIRSEIAALTAEVARLKKAAKAFKSDVSDVAGTGFLNWRLLLDAHCDRFAALLDQPEGGPDA